VIMEETRRGGTIHQRAGQKLNFRTDKASKGREGLAEKKKRLKKSTPSLMSRLSTNRAEGRERS